jgi:PAS domain S-box-containing protein
MLFGEGLQARHDAEVAMTDELAELRRQNAELRAALEEKIQALRVQGDFRASFESAAVGQLHSTPDGVVIRTNRAFAAFLGYEPEELVGRSIWDFTWPEDQEVGRASHQKLIDGALPSYAREKRYRRRDGAPAWGRVSASVVRDSATGEPLISVAIIEDIEARRRAEIALQQANEDLERALSERTAALMQRDLLLREVYHRVKNNLQVVDSLIVMQAKRMEDAEARAALANLRARIYALGLVHHQLMGSKDLQTFDIEPFLTELSQHLLEGVAGSGIALAVKAEALRVGLDFAIPLGLLVTELVTNAIKHAFPDGRGRVEVALSAARDGEVVLRVSDNGCGYDPEAAVKARSLGGVIIAGLVHQLRAGMTVRHSGGTVIEVRLPSPEA